MENKLRICLQENQFLVPSYLHYGGAAGFQDYGILGVKVKNQLINIWRDYFLKDDNVFEIETPIIMPNEILKASGHIDRFTDYVVYDENQNCYRADHLVKDYFKKNGEDDLANRVDSMNPEMLEKYINERQMVSPPRNGVGESLPIKVITKNLMFPVPSAAKEVVDYLRPELAQSMFVNFKVCQQFLGRDAPFGLAQIGRSYRNEISPKPLTRMREFTQAEIEYFVDPDDKNHPLYDRMKNEKIRILTSEMQNLGQTDAINLTIDEAINKGYIAHKTMGYFLGRIHQFAIAIGLDDNKIRFRQHLSSEMAHYANDCWDLEAYVNKDWLECIGCADRGSYDLKAHSKHGQLTLKRVLKEPLAVDKLKVSINKKLVGENFKSSTQKIVNYFDNLDQNGICELKRMLEKGPDPICIKIDDGVYNMNKDMVTIEKIRSTITTVEYYPHIIEPSFGIDRLMYSIFDHNFWVREGDENRIVLSLPQGLTPYDVAVFQLHNKDSMIEIAKRIKNMLNENKLTCYIDNSGTTIGKRYARLDEIGVKYAITVDPGTLKDQQVTIRDRDSMKQIRVEIDKIIEILEINLV